MNVRELYMILDDFVKNKRCSDKNIVFHHNEIDYPIKFVVLDKDDDAVVISTIQIK